MAPLKKWSVVAVALAALVAGFILLRHDRGLGARPLPSKGSLAPDFTLPQLDGRELRLSSYRGKIVLLDFWATWCTPCREEIPSFVELKNKYGKDGLEIVGVSMDDGPEPVRTFYQQFHMNYPVVMGNANLGEQYGGVLGLPIAFLLDREGHIRAKHIGATKPETIEKEAVGLLESR